MLRLLWYLFVGYVIWKIVQWISGAVSGPERPRPSAPPPGAAKRQTPSDFSDIRDAEFEDIPPKKEPGTKSS